MEWRAFVLKAKTKPGILFTDNGDLFTIRLARSETLCIDHSAGSLGEVFAPCRGIRIPDSGKFSLVDWFRNPGYFALNPGSLGFGFRNTARGIRNTVSDWNPDCSTWNPESTAWNPKYKTVLDSMGRKCQGCPTSREWIHQTRTFWNWNWSSETFGRR